MHLSCVLCVMLRDHDTPFSALPETKIELFCPGSRVIASIVFGHYNSSNVKTIASYSPEVDMTVYRGSYLQLTSVAFVQHQ